ncbi:DivIVA domain-containing protein [Ruicaihuangia caeni]|uniref:Cell wall synthesis protein Wag31 n=1 Tax=Ruicaihuangia caeni TaxID=3042517 RepID=A0AAW6T5V3_9MICO|nr:DivIVA domain-containing protein [Klugiella sp. YN-L-19]MDI2097729.1 DivIVA domain-containing protein [Klugiella sp. YN-L-19]
MSTFPRTGRSARGYDVDEVERFLAAAREAYLADGDATHDVTSDSIRHTAFGLVRDGYDPAMVDAALERLEDAFATRERERALEREGRSAWDQQARGAAQEVLDRLSRPAGKRFRRVGLLTTGYRVGDVDAFAKRITDFLQLGTPLTVTEVRTVVFRAAKRGYDEGQVDLLLDEVVRTMLAVR